MFLSSFLRRSLRSYRSFSTALDPLTATEIGIARDAITQTVAQPRFVAMSRVAPQVAEVILLDQTAHEYRVDLKTSEIVHQQVTDEQPMLTPWDCDVAESIVQSNPEVKKALQERYGITDMSRVACDPWSVHIASPEDEELRLTPDGKHRRLVQTFLYYRQDGEGLEDNHYAHPIDILPIVDLNSNSLVTIQGMDRPAPSLPTDSVQYHRNLLKTNTYLPTEFREPPKPLNVVQPDGPSFTVDGHNVNWEKWDFHVGMHYRDGLVLSDIKYDGRSVVKRLALVEMAVPYADPHPPFTRKCAFDVGDYGLGYCANSLELGCDCLGHIHYFDAVFCDADGNPVTKPKAICMHEEDTGVLWKHVEYRNGHNESRRARELVVSFIATIVNYEYLFYVRFRQDGCIDYQIKLSGELSTNLLSQGEETPSHGVMVSPGVNSQIHQHMFCARIDMAVDSELNTISEIDVETEPIGPNNPYGNGFNAKETVLSSELQAQRLADANKARAWKISNAEGYTNKFGKPTAYKLIPFSQGAAQPTLLTDATSKVSEKGNFATKHLWVTPFDETERYPSGEYTPQGDGSKGLPAWTAQDRNLEKEKLVVWHCFGVTHVPRPEDFPVMPCELTGFTLKPDGFYDGNPGVDLPPEVNEASELAVGSCCNQK